MTDIPELSADDFERGLTGSRRQRFIAGDFRSGKDIADLRAFVGLSQPSFAAALGISVHTLRGWEQGRRKPHGPGIALLRIAARHPKLIRENTALAA
jgi:DNA-binding transcriptional regulator YiaG